VQSETALWQIEARIVESHENSREKEVASRCESYLLLKGRFMDGDIRYKSIEVVSSNGLAFNLWPELANNNYHAAMDTKSADLLVVMHWGIAELGVKATGV